MTNRVSFNEVLKELEKLNLDDYNLPDSVKLEFYKYYKQATVGDCNKDRPWSPFVCNLTNPEHIFIKGYLPLCFRFAFQGIKFDTP